MASTRRFRILFVGFGKRNSFLRAEIQALEAVDAELLVSRIRLRHFEGLLLPGLWLQAFGFGGASDVPILGWETYTVAGMGVVLKPRRIPGTRRPDAASATPGPALNAPAGSP